MAREWCGFWWIETRRRFDKLGGTLTVLGVLVGGTALISSRLASLAPRWESFLTWAGAILSLSALIYCVWQSICAYPRYSRLVQGRKETLAAIKQVNPNCVKVALVGDGHV